MKAGFLSLIAAVVLLGCASEFDRVDAQREYSAYGRMWRYTSIEHRSRVWELFTTHGYIGEVDRVRQEIVLETEQGERIPVNDRLLALQRNGSYKKVECCFDFNTLARVYALDDKLFIQFLQRRGITDCFVYPAGRPDNEKRPAMEQVRWIEFFGEYDPVEKVFYVKSFFAGIPPEAKKGPGWSEMVAKESFENATKRYFLNRTPFLCNGEVPSPPPETGPGVTH